MSKVPNEIKQTKEYKEALRHSYRKRHYTIDNNGTQAITGFPQEVGDAFEYVLHHHKKLVESRAEFLKEVEKWFERDGLEYYYDLDEPLGAILITPRVRDREGLTKLTYARTLNTITKFITKRLEEVYGKGNEDKPIPPLKPVKKDGRAGRIIVDKRYDKRVDTLEPTHIYDPNTNPYGI